MGLDLLEDEREAVVRASADRLAYVVLSFGVLAIVAWRAIATGASSLDLLALVVASGAVSLLYQARHGAVSHRTMVLGAFALAVGGFVAAVAAGLLRT